MVKPGDPRRAFPTNIIVSYADLDILPYQMTDRMSHTSIGLGGKVLLTRFPASDARELCEVESDLSTADEKKFKEKNHRFWNKGERYFKVEYQVKVVIGPADIRFELCKIIFASKVLSAGCS
jgi:hypothetical protein